MSHYRIVDQQAFEQATAPAPILGAVTRSRSAESIVTIYLDHDAVEIGRQAVILDSQGKPVECIRYLRCELHPEIIVSPLFAEERL